jgi:transcriptional regulator with XRE-family HTH domain
MKLGNSIKRLRKEKKIRQNELANRINISPTYLSQIENNVKVPSVNTLELIANALSTPVPIIYFFATEEEDIAPEKWGAFKAISPLVKACFED